MVSSVCVCPYRIGDLLREVEDGPIKCPCVSNDWFVFIQQLKPHVFTLNNRSEGWRRVRVRGREGGEGRRGRGGKREKANRKVVGTSVNVNGLLVSRDISKYVNIFMSKQTPAVETHHSTYSKETAYWNTPSLLPFSIT